MTAIPQGWGLERKSKLAHAEAKTAKKAPVQQSGSSVEPPAPDPAAGRAMAQFEALPLSDQKRVLERFAATLKGPVKKTYDTQGLGSPMIRGSLAGWLARGG